MLFLSTDLKLLLIVLLVFISYTIYRYKALWLLVGLSMAHIRRTWVELDQHAFEHNINCYKQIIGPRVMISLVVKANAYGHGIREIGALAEHNEHITMLDTASLSEALTLRASGVRKPILVLGIIDQDPSLAIIHNIDLVVSDRALLEELNACAAAIDKKCSIHIKVDTGLARLGVPLKDAVSLIQYAQTLPCITVNGICSHFAESSSEDQTYTKLQYDRFITLLKELEALKIYIPYRHMTNSAASTSYDLSMFNMIRVAAGMYGLSPSQAHKERTLALHPDYRLEPVLSWHTSVCHVRTLPANTYVGYDRTYTTTAETTIALLPIGYSDGYDKRLSNKSMVYIPHADMFVPVIGRIAMNMMTIDVSHVPDINIGTEVVLVGKQQEISAVTLAELSGSHNAREITLHILADIPRIVIPHQEATEKNSPLYTKNSKTKRIGT